MKKITQAEARRMRARVAQLEQRQSSFHLGAPGIEIGTVSMDRGYFMGQVNMAKRLGCAVVVTATDCVLTLRAVKP